MQKLMNWLTEEAKGVRQIAGYVLMAALVDVALTYTVRAALINWGSLSTSTIPTPRTRSATTTS